MSLGHRLLTLTIFSLTIVIGIVALAYPFIVVSLPAASGENALGANEGLLLSALLISLCLAVLLVELQGRAIGAKTVAALGVLVAGTATLRFIEVSIPGPAGFSPIFAPIILGGYVFGARFGFLLGAMTLLVSAFITAGVGPWLPYQMFAAGWVGLTAGLLPHLSKPRAELALLLVFGFVWGFVYGAIMNLSTWPYLAGDPRLTWTPDAGIGETFNRYLVYYVTTSLWWDSAAALGNVLLIAVLGLPAVKALTRFRDRFQFQVRLP
jgi:energy-coupling factor transport system substrate-specific component